jgi:hypothetical protein
MSNVTRISYRIGTAGPVRFVRGRNAWTLDRLLAAGERGVTPIEQPAPRWSQYVAILRGQGLSIETIEERHGGPFRGWHGRYVLRSPVQVVEREVTP